MFFSSLQWFSVVRSGVQLCAAMCSGFQRCSVLYSVVQWWCIYYFLFVSEMYSFLCVSHEFYVLSLLHAWSDFYFLFVPFFGWFTHSGLLIRVPVVSFSVEVVWAFSIGRAKGTGYGCNPYLFHFPHSCNFHYMAHSYCPSLRYCLQL